MRNKLHQLFAIIALVLLIAADDPVSPQECLAMFKDASQIADKRPNEALGKYNAICTDCDNIGLKEKALWALGALHKEYLFNGLITESCRLYDQGNNTVEAWWKYIVWVQNLPPAEHTSLRKNNRGDIELAIVEVVLAANKRGFKPVSCTSGEDYDVTQLFQILSDVKAAHFNRAGLDAWSKSLIRYCDDSGNTPPLAEWLVTHNKKSLLGHPSHWTDFLEKYEQWIGTRNAPAPGSNELLRHRNTIATLQRIMKANL